MAQSIDLVLVFQNYEIDKTNSGWFILDNGSNKNKVFVQLFKAILFDLIKKRLTYIRHIINLANKTFLFSNHLTDLNNRI